MSSGGEILGQGSARRTLLWVVLFPAVTICHTDIVLIKGDCWGRVLGGILLDKLITVGMVGLVLVVWDLVGVRLLGGQLTGT